MEGRDLDYLVNQLLDSTKLWKQIGDYVSFTCEQINTATTYVSNGRILYESLDFCHSYQIHQVIL